MALNVGELYVTISAEVSGLKNLVPALQKVESSMNNLAATVTKLEATMSNAYTKVAVTAQKSADKQVESSKKVKAANKEQELSAKQLDAAIALQNTALSKAAVQVQAFVASSSKISGSKSSIDSVTASYENLKKTLTSGPLSKTDTASAKNAFTESLSSAKLSIKQLKDTQKASDDAKKAAIKNEADKNAQIEQLWTSQSQKIGSIEDAWKQAEKAKAAESSKTATEVKEGFKEIADAEKARTAASKAAVKEGLQQNKEYVKSVEEAAKAQAKMAKPTSTKKSSGASAKDAVRTFDLVEDALLRQETIVQRAKTKHDDLIHTMAKYKIPQKEIDKLTSAYKEMEDTLSKGALSKGTVAKSQNSFNNAVATSRAELKKTDPPLSKFQLSLKESAKTASVALGPLSGVASRLTAIASIASSTTIHMAAVLGSFAALSVLSYKSVIAGAKMESQLFKIEGALKAFGNQTGLSVAQVDAFSKELAEVTLTSVELAREASVSLLAFRGITEESFKSALYLAQDLTETFGGSLLENTKKLGKVFDDPSKGLDRLSESGVRFTNSQKRQIEALVATGRAAEATDIVLKEIASHAGGRGADAAKGLAGAWDTLGLRITNFVEAVGTAQKGGNSLAETVNKISAVVKKYTEDTGFAAEVGETLGVVLSGLSKIVLFLAEHLQTVISVLVAFGVTTLLAKVIPALKLYTKDVIIAAKAQGVLGVATSALSSKMKLLTTVMKGNAFVLLGTYVASAAVEYFLFSKSAESAAKAQKEVNEEVTKGAEAIKSLTTAQKVADHESSIKSLKDNIKHFEAQRKNIDRNSAGYKVWSGLIAKATAEIKKHNEAIASIDLETTSNNIRLAEDRFRSYHSELVSGQGEFEKYANAQANLATIQGYLSNNTAEGRKVFADYLKSIGDTRKIEDVRAELEKMAGELSSAVGEGAFASVRKNIEDLSLNANEARGSLNTFNAQGEAGVVRLGDAFNKLRTQAKFEDIFRDATTDKVSTALKALGYNIEDTFDITDAKNLAVQGMTELEISVSKANRTLAVTTEFSDKFRDLGIQLKTVDQASTFNKINAFFGGDTIDKLVQLNLKTDEYSRKLANMPEEDVENLRLKLVELGKASNKDFFKGISDPKSVAGIAAAAAVAEQSTEKVKVSLKEVGSVVQNVVGEFANMFGQISNNYANLASYQAQAAQEALQYGRSQSEFYMQLADSVRYSNNAQAKSFEDRAISIAKSSAKEYQAQQAARARSNAEAKKAFDNQKKLQVAQAVMSTASAAIQTWANLGGWPLGAAGAAAMGVIGGAQIAAIQKQSYTPREKGGPIVGGKPYLVGEAGPELITPSRSGYVTNNKDLMDSVGGSTGSTSYTINVYAHDATGFDKLLQSRRGQIVGMLKEASNSRMRDNTL